MARAMIVAVVLIVGLTACGDASSPSAQPTVSDAPSSPNETTTTASPEAPVLPITPPASRDPEPAVPPTTEQTSNVPVSPGNRNDRGTPMGELCWQIYAFGEVNAKLIVGGTRAAPSVTLKEYLAGAEQGLSPVVGKLSPAVIPFGRRFLAEIKAANVKASSPGVDPPTLRGEVERALIGEVGNYPGFDDFLNAEPGCLWEPDPEPWPPPRGG